MAHLHSVYDTDPHFQIDGVTRSVKNASSTKTVLIQHDHNSERFTFEIPRMVDGHDMSTCNVVQIHYINIDSTDKSKQYSGIYEVEDLQISPDSNDVVICSWLISANATQYVGNLSFVVRFACTSDYSIDYAWNTAIHSNVYVSKGICNSDVVAEEYADILEHWKKELIESGGVTDDRIEEVLEKYISENGIPGGGLTANAQKLLVTILRNAVYSSNQSTNITLLEKELGKTTVEDDENDDPSTETVYTIAYSTQNVTSSNNDITIVENAAYTATLTADDGYTLDSVTVTMGGVDVTADVYADGVISISAVTGNVEIVASAVGSGTGDDSGDTSDVELLTDGLVDYFDFRNSDGLVGNSSTGYKCASTIGDGCLFSWYAVNGGDNYGVPGLYGTYDRNGGVSGTAMGQNLTVCTLSYRGAATNGFCWNNYVGAGNYLVVLNQQYIDTSGNKQSIERKLISGNAGYNAIIMSISPEKMCVYINGELKEEILTSQLTNFASWPTKVAVGSGYSSSNGVALAIYDRTLTEVEVVEVSEYFKTLEVV